VISLTSRQLVSNNSPTSQTYAELQQAFEHFNLTLFSDSLPGCLLTLQREKRTHGYFSPERFGNKVGEKVDEIALNPAYFAVQSLQEIMQTIVHEMCHLWQHHHGKPGRGRYHNPEWANKMEFIGLMPSSTGKPGGRRVGDHMADYPVSGGRFEKACEALLSKEFQISWYDRFPPPQAMSEPLEQPQEGSALQGPVDLAGKALADLVPEVRANLVISVKSEGVAASKPTRAKYRCVCDHLLWAKPGLRVQCLECSSDFVEVGLQ
jgi:predicted SprT family Zn-dependent metalloprotease